MNILSKQQHLFVKNAVDKHLGFKENHNYSENEEIKIKKVVANFVNSINEEASVPKVLDGYLDDYLDFLVICACADSVE